MSRIKKIQSLYENQIINYVKKQNIHISDIDSIWTMIFDNDSSPNKKNVRWIVETLLNDGFLWEDMLPGKDSKVYETITLFDKHKSKLSIENRSLMAYKTLGNLWNSVKQYQGELSGKELKREEQEKIYRETEFIYKDEETGFQIVSPLTEESAKWWGKGTRWCTSAEKNNMFDYYSHKSPLLILLVSSSENAIGNGQKLQLWKYKNEIQFMDESDNMVSLEYIEQNWTIIKDVIYYMSLLKYIPERYRTEELIVDFLKKDIQNAFQLHNEGKNVNQYLDVLLENSEHILSLYSLFEHNVLDINKSNIEKIIKHNINNARSFILFENINSQKYMTNKEMNDFVFLCLKEHYDLSEYFKQMNDSYKNIDLCFKALNLNPSLMEYVPEEQKTKELCEYACKLKPSNILYIKNEYRTYEMFENFVNYYMKNSNEIKIYGPMILPSHLRKNEKLFMLLAKTGHKHLFNSLPYFNVEICIEALNVNPELIIYVPKNIKLTESICEKIIEYNPDFLQFLSDDNKTKKIRNMAIDKNPSLMSYIKHEYRTKEMYDKWFNKNPDSAMLNLPNEYKSDDKWKYAVEAAAINIKRLPKHLMNEDFIMSLDIHKMKSHYAFISEVNNILYSIPSSLVLELSKLDSRVIKYVPVEYINKKFIKSMLEKPTNIIGLLDSSYYGENKLLTILSENEIKNYIMKVLKIEPHNFIYLPEKYQTQELFDTINQNKDSIQKFKKSQFKRFLEPKSLFDFNFDSKIEEIKSLFIKTRYNDYKSDIKGVTI